MNASFLRVNRFQISAEYADLIDLIILVPNLKNQTILDYIANKFISPSGRAVRIGMNMPAARGKANDPIFESFGIFLSNCEC